MSLAGDAEHEFFGTTLSARVLAGVFFFHRYHLGLPTI